MRVLVCGGRDFDDIHLMRKVLSWLDPDLTTIVHGGAKGADTLAHKVAIEYGMDTEVHMAQWVRYGKGAGPKRNQEMLDSGVDRVIAFPGGRGTEDMVNRARSAHIRVWCLIEKS